MRVWRKTVCGKQLLHIWSVLLTSCILTACDQPGQLATPQPTELPVLTTVPSAISNGTLPGMATRSADETRIAQWRHDLETVVALTPRPPEATYVLSGPTPTWALGRVFCSGGSSLEPMQYSCWRGLVDGELITVAAGQQNFYGDRSQGLFIVFHRGVFDSSASSTEVYSTPLKLGGVQILEIDGTRFTLAPYDPMATYIPEPQRSPTPGIVFVFDLATRQWVSPPPSLGPSPSAIPTSGPSPIPSP